MCAGVGISLTPVKQQNRPLGVMVRHLYGFATTKDLADGPRAPDLSSEEHRLSICVDVVEQSIGNAVEDERIVIQPLQIIDFIGIFESDCAGLRGPEVAPTIVRVAREDHGAGRRRPARLEAAIGDSVTVRRRLCQTRWTSGFDLRFQRADHRSVNGQLQRAKKQVSIRGLNRNHNHDLKNLFKGAAVVASNKPGPFQEFYATLLAKGIRPEMARLTLARKIATIVLIVWKRGACFDAQHLKPQTA